MSRIIACLPFLLRSANIVVLTGVVLAFFDIGLWGLELFVHFVFQYFWLSLFFCVVTFYLGMRNSGVFAVCSVVLCLVHLSQFYTDDNKSSISNASQTSITNNKLRILSANVYTNNPHKQEFLKLIDDVQPDVLAVTELSESWHQAIESSASFVDSKTSARGDNFGIGLYARDGLLKTAKIEPIVDDLPFIHSQVALGSDYINFFVVHAVPPVNQRLKDKRDKMIDTVARHVRSQENLSVVCGDFNTTPWTKAYRSFVAVSRLIDSQLSQGLKLTWRSASTVVSIPIDFCFVPKGTQVIKHQSFAVKGSDHNAILLELEISDRQ